MYDYLIIGAGIVGLATAYAIQNKYPQAKILITEKENEPAFHQTGHNSGVIHSGIYYQPGSLKARFAKEGGARLRHFCETHQVPYETCGKVIVATQENELQNLEALYQRGLENGLTLTRLSADGLKEYEPHVAGIRGILVPATGIVDYKQVARALADDLRAHENEIFFNTEIKKISHQPDGVTVVSDKGSYTAHFLINCGGLHCDQIARMAGVNPGMKIVPFRGEYYELKPEQRQLVKHLIYPVPNPKFPFLGVHFTRMIDGRVLAGPNAVPGLKRESYRKSDFDFKEFIDTLTYPAFWKMGSQNLRFGLGEIIRSLSKKRFVARMKALLPEIREEDVIPSHAGVRAQALTDDGKLADDFIMIHHENALHILNAPSPAATASFSIGEAICSEVPEPTHLTLV
ncbi:L-2-hydroxyglutarate oxidase [Sporolactobacillus spathodeae]|uniref:L-2-hydroxyglutarate oxidase n=1 Tax=Sporolactobacillus spathodeae TaxID=1465502 RepID=A0ABS2Q9T0_9BACL|nr:L-2-hydroxyglutarate oxidase [Sporolactobacillus spathodeae]MBM7658200.1 L-2-hydroxyglutarate oxidase [Sporolactobacillus spathodeae]